MTWTHPQLQLGAKEPMSFGCPIQALGWGASRVCGLGGGSGLGAMLGAEGSALKQLLEGL